MCSRTGYRTRDLWRLSQTGYRLRNADSLQKDTGTDCERNEADCF